MSLLKCELIKVAMRKKVYELKHVTKNLFECFRLNNGV